MKTSQSKLHRIGTYDVCKISLSCFDDKRYILDDGVSSLAYFWKECKKLMKSLKSMKSMKLIKSIESIKRLCSWSSFLFSSIYIEGTKKKSTFYFSLLSVFKWKNVQTKNIWIKSEFDRCLKFA